MVLESASRALRQRDPDVLRDGLAELLRATDVPLADSRDLMMCLAPLHDCAVRLGIDPAELFEEFAQGQPGEVAELLRNFGRRDDVTPEAFRFVVEDGSSGLQYRWV
jgi:hypothetical protein